jgi:hypothetical protein
MGRADMDGLNRCVTCCSNHRWGSQAQLEWVTANSLPVSQTPTLPGPVARHLYSPAYALSSTNA